jgi:acyl dehydratase
MEGTVLAFREVNDWKFSRPVFLGDTLHAILEVASAKAIPRLGGGSVELRVSVNNQKDETVMAGLWTVLIQSRPSADP